LSQDKFRDAKDIYIVVIPLCERQFGPNDAKIIDAMDSLYNATKLHLRYWRDRYRADAGDREQYIDKSLTTFTMLKRKFGANDPRTVEIRESVASAYCFWAGDHYAKYDEYDEICSILLHELELEIDDIRVKNVKGKKSYEDTLNQWTWENKRREEEQREEERIYELRREFSNLHYDMRYCEIFEYDEEKAFENWCRYRSEPTYDGD
jgi:hypothetical protein